MIILFRKADGWFQNTSLYDWQPVNSTNGRWYRTREENISLGQLTPEKSTYLRQLFNAALSGLTCRVHAKYDRTTKILELRV